MTLTLRNSKFYKAITGWREKSPHCQPHLTEAGHCLCQCGECADLEGDGHCICTECSIKPEDALPMNVETNAIADAVRQAREDGSQ